MCLQAGETVSLWWILSFLWCPSWANGEVCWHPKQRSVCVLPRWGHVGTLERDLAPAAKKLASTSVEFLFEMENLRCFWTPRASKFLSGPSLCFYVQITQNQVSETFTVSACLRVQSLCVSSVTKIRCSIHTLLKGLTFKDLRALFGCDL